MIRKRVLINKNIMKKILLLLIVLTAFSCSDELTCKRKVMFRIVDSNEFYYKVVPVDCATNQPLEVKENEYVSNEK
jgi:hypothetical protein